jgi:peptidoglycan/LPS O-acetylase OafA/YrhL
MKNRILGLDVIRASAILFVLIAHTLRYIFSDDVGGLLSLYFGFLGVEIFFVLSGFLIGTILIKIHNRKEHNTFHSVRSFWIRRWFRTLPNYFLVLIVYFVYYWIWQSEFLLSEARYWAFFVFLQNSISYHPSFFAPAWSLSIEEWFYISFPIVLLLIDQKAFKRKDRSLIVAIIVFLFASLSLRLVLAFFINIDWDGGFRKLMPLRLDAITMGVLAAYVRFYHHDFLARNKNLLFTIGVIMIVILSIYFYYDYLSDFRAGFFTETVFFTFFSFSISLLMPAFSSVRATNFSRFDRSMTHISLISYSMYLNHSLIIDFVDSGLFDGAANLFKFFLVWTLTLIISTIQYQYFEKPLTDLRNIYTDKKERITVVSTT